MTIGLLDHPASNLAPIHGTCNDEFAGVREVFADNLNTTRDIGASVAVFMDGECVVDLWGGYYDMTFAREWERHTIVQMFSNTKTLTALSALVLADRGVIDLDAQVSKYWPEFAENGKGDIQVRQLLNYSSGVAGWTEHMTLPAIYDTEKSSALLARQAPWWKPGTAHGYHGFTIGHLVSEIVRRTTGKSLGQFLREEIAAPLGVEDDVHIGTAAKYDPVVCLMTPGRPQDNAIGGDSLYDRALFNPRVTVHDTWTVKWRRAEMGAMNGHANARGVAAVNSALANGGAFGKRLMSDAGRLRVLEQQVRGTDLVFGFPINWGLGYSLDGAFLSGETGSRQAWWGGAGGSIAFVDLDARMSFSYVPNKWITGGYEQERGRRLLQAVYSAMKVAAR